MIDQERVRAYNVHIMKKDIWCWKFCFCLVLFGSVIFAGVSGCVKSPSPAPKFSPTNAPILQPTETVPSSSPVAVPSSTPFTTSVSSIKISPEPAQASALSIEDIQQIFEQVNRDRVLKDLKQLTGEAPICIDNQCYTITNRETGSEGLRWAKAYIYRELVNSGYSVDVQDWSKEGWADQNFIVRKPGSLHPEEEIYFVAHMDGVKEGPAADDNASGVVDVLELARILSKQSLDRTVTFLFTTGEEHGVLGSYYYMDQLSPQETAAIKYVIDVDMVGYDKNGDGVMQLWSGDHPPSLELARMVADIIQSYPLKLTPRIVTGCT